MVSKEEQELIEARKQWADTPIINFWHDTNDAPDAFFDELLAATRDEEASSKMTRTTTRTSSGARKAKSSYAGHSVKSPQAKYPITNKKWGKFWEVVSAMNKANGKENIPTRAQRSAGKDDLTFVVTKGLDLRVGTKRKSTTAFESGPYNTVIDYVMLDRECTNCGNKWTTDDRWKDSKAGKTCPECRAFEKFKDIKGPYTVSSDTLLFPVGLAGDGQTIALAMLQGKEAKEFADLKPGDRIKWKGFIKGAWFDITVPSGGGFDRMRPSGWKYADAKKEGGYGVVPLMTLGGKRYGGYIESA